MEINGTAEFTSHGTLTTSTSTTTTIGSSTLYLKVSEDAWNGDAQFTVNVDGHQVGGTQTATASHALGQWQIVTLTGDFGAGPHTVDVNFINDAWGGTSDADRNLYVRAIDLNGETVLGSAAADNAANGSASADPSSAVMMTNGTAEFKTTGVNTATNSTIVLHVSEDAWNGDAQFTVVVDGQQVGGIQTATASHAAGQVQDITLVGNFGSTGPGKVDVNFINDAWGGSATTDRNLYVQSIDVNGVHFAGNQASDNAANGGASTDPNAAVMDVNGTTEFAVNHTTTPSDFWHV
jgi:endoglucanase